MMNIKDLKNKKKIQIKDVREFWNSKMEVQCMKPQAWDQLDKYESTRIATDQEISPHP